MRYGQYILHTYARYMYTYMYIHVLVYLTYCCRTTCEESRSHIKWQSCEGVHTQSSCTCAYHCRQQNSTFLVHGRWCARQVMRIPCWWARNSCCPEIAAPPWLFFMCTIHTCSWFKRYVYLTIANMGTAPRIIELHARVTLTPLCGYRVSFPNHIQLCHVQKII